MKFWLSSIIILCLFSFILSNNHADGFIEIKKYKVINSKDVCGDKLCSALVEQKAKKGISTLDNKVCKNTLCDAQGTSSKPLYKTGSYPRLNIDSFSVNGQDFLLFKGQKWHNLHNVEISIRGQTFETVTKSKTDDRGNLYMPWQIPDTFVDGTYIISAEDGINNIKITVEIMIGKNISIVVHKADKCTSTKAPVDWSGCDLYGRVMTNVDLRMAKLSNANLFGATLENMDLSGADLRNANLKEANLDGAILVNADLSYSNMVNAKVREADLKNTKMVSAKLFRTDFTNSNLENVDFTRATLSYSNLSFANMKGANLENAGTWAANLNHCKNHPICEN